MALFANFRFKLQNSFNVIFIGRSIKENCLICYLESLLLFEKCIGTDDESTISSESLLGTAEFPPGRINSRNPFQNGYSNRSNIRKPLSSHSSLIIFFLM